MFYLNDYLLAELARQHLADLRREAEAERLWRALSRNQSHRSARFWRKVSGLLTTAGERLLKYSQQQVTTFTHNNPPAGQLAGK
jgi:hypothetical protein